MVSSGFNAFCFGDVGVYLCSPSVLSNSNHEKGIILQYNIVDYKYDTEAILKLRFGVVFVFMRVLQRTPLTKIILV